MNWPNLTAAIARNLRPIFFTLAVLSVSLSCSTAASKNVSAPDGSASGAKEISKSAEPAGKGATITIDPNSPADTVRAFYKLLREKKFRDAIFLTNLRPAIEGLTESELKDFSVDFEAIAGQVPTEIQINGEIISGDSATVTANLPDPEYDEMSLQQIKLKKINGTWIIQTVDEEAETRISTEGKNYFYNLRIETHEDEARKMLERISKAELAHSLQNGGAFTDMESLIKTGLLPDDIRTSLSTGYDYAVRLADNKRSYFATATPAEYGKSGKLSFLLELDNKGISRVSSKDNGGKPMR
jgi:hypothetical protein